MDGYNEWFNSMGEKMGLVMDIMNGSMGLVCFREVFNGLWAADCRACIERCLVSG